MPTAQTSSTTAKTPKRKRPVNLAWYETDAVDSAGEVALAWTDCDPNQE
jgi:hypothetical protein